jgi:peptidoglycan L-alanyl-D-glutamate endopeptidase CwlK
VHQPAEGANGKAAGLSQGEQLEFSMDAYHQYFEYRPTTITAYDAPPDNLAGLKPVFREKVELTMIELEQQGWDPRVAEGLRTPAQQAAKVSGGTSRTLNSAHLKGYGADIIDRRWGWGGPAAKHSFRFWHELGGAAQRQGLTWGGLWRTFPDPAHVEMPNWRALP